MSGIKFKYWRTVGVAAATFGVAACGGDGATTEEAQTAANEACDQAAAETPASAEAPAAAAAAGGEAGEAGAQTAYAGLSGDQRTALRLQHLKGFVLAADRVAAAGQQPEAGVLVSQGLLEVYDVAATEFGSLNVELVRAAADGSPANIDAAEAEIDRAMGALTDVKPAEIVARLTDISTGLYQHVIQCDFVDPIEYQHSMGAALAAQGVLQASEATLSAEDAAAYAAANEQMTRYVALWPQVSAPEAPTPYREMLATSSRIRLALYPYF